MNKIAIITDSTCGLPQEYIDKYNVKVARAKIVYKDKEYLDGLTISAEEVYSRLSEEVPTTSLPSVTDVCNIYNELIEEGYTHVLALPVSSGLSGTINSFRLAAEEYEGKIVSKVYDSKLLSMAIGMIIIELGEFLKDSVDFDDVVKKAEDLASKTSVYLTLETLEYLIKGGRIGRVSGGIGQMLNLKPIITMGEDGSYETHGKARGIKLAVNKLIKIVDGLIENKNGKIVIMTGTMGEEAKMLEKRFSSYSNISFVYSGTITPAVGVHSGPGVIAVGVMALD